MAKVREFFPVPSNMNANSLGKGKNKRHELQQLLFYRTLIAVISVISTPFNSEFLDNVILTRDC